jgi:outer membrane protein assembly factor BamB
MTSRATVALLFSLSIAWTVAADSARSSGPEVEWPQWRGPDGNGIAACGQWNPAALSGTPKIAWRAQVGGGYSSMVVKGGRLYATGGQNGTNTVYCLDAVTGEEAWSHAYQSPKGQPRATPAVDDGLVYVVSTDGYLLCLDENTGEEQWLVDMVKKFQAAGPIYGHSGSPRIAGNLLLLNAGQSGLALDKKTGEKVWASGPGKGGYATPIVRETSNPLFAAIFGQDHLYAVAINDGKVLWSHPWSKPNLITAPEPVLFGSKIFVTTGSSDGSCALLDVAGELPQVVWKSRVMAAHFSSGVRFDNYLYAVHGDAPKRGTNTPPSILKCIDLNDGTEMWSREIGFGSLIAIDRKLIVLRDQGEVFIAEADPAAFHELARGIVLSGECWTEPAFCGGRLYCRNTPGEVVCIDLTD